MREPESIRVVVGEENPILREGVVHVPTKVPMASATC
jgi:hypothetical protein